MQWFTGGVPSAIATCRQQKALFIVYIHDDGAGSITMEESWKSTEVLEVVAANSHVALKIAKDSVEYLQFSQLYPVFVFPTVFCIGMTGKSLVVMNGAQNNQQMTGKLKEAFQKLQNELSPPPPSSQPSLPNDPAPKSSPPTTSPSPPLPATPPSFEAPPTPSSSAMSEGAVGEVGAEPGETQEEKLRRYREAMKQKRLEREAEELQKQKQKEIARRQNSKEAEQFRRSQEDRQSQNWILERRKQKEQERQAREEVKAKLEQDRLERIAQRQKKASEAAELRQRPNATTSSPTVSSVMSSVSTGSVCRIQLRLPAGGTSVVEMNRTDTLGALRDRVAMHLGEDSKSISLTSVYPRKDLDQEMASITLTQLQLVPSGVVIVRKKGMMSGRQGGGGGGGGLWGFLVTLLQLVVWFFTYLKNALTGLISGPPKAPPPRSPLATQGSSPGSGGSGGRVRKFRQEDFGDQEEDEEKRKGTYNGNSTQQQ